MDKVKVIISNEQKEVAVPTGIRLLIRRCCHAVLQEEDFHDNAEVSVSFVNNEQIHELNKNTEMLTEKRMSSAFRSAKTGSMIQTSTQAQNFWAILLSAFRKQWSRQISTTIRFKEKSAF